MLLTGVAADIEFNTDVLDVTDCANIDLQQFSRGNFIMPGDYLFAVHINKQTLTNQPVAFTRRMTMPKAVKPVSRHSWWSNWD